MKKEGGTYVVPVLINNAITLDFIVDSGASSLLAGSRPSTAALRSANSRTFEPRL
jgi:hypothetical protein